MTRPKVDPDKRQRTAQACDSCKRRKQKCNGQKQCSTCIKRNLDCVYTPTSLETGSQEPLGSPTKRRHIDSSPRMLKSTMDSGQTITAHTPSLVSWNQSTDRPTTSVSKTESAEPTETNLMETPRQLLGSSDRDFDSRSRISNASGTAEEAVLGFFPRMLMDRKGRLLYVGESASLSYLNLIRMIVGSVSGSSTFTEDRQRHNILENTIQLPQDTRPTGVLPERKTADILVNSFFTNTSGFVEIFQKMDFLRSVEECYNQPLSMSKSSLCILNLVFAIGLVFARPLQGTDEAAVIEKLHSEPTNRADLFFLNAKSLYDPVIGLEDADFWSIQALLLISLYMLAISARNASYVYCGMAVRSALALGLHREESMEIFNESVRELRKNVWRSLFILDRFLAASLGRPMAISEDDCSENALESSRGTAADETVMAGDTQTTNSVALDAAVRSCFLIGATLKKVYSRGKVSTLVGQEITDRLEKWERDLHQSLHCRRMMDGPIDPAEAIAILHVNLLHCHSVLLLTRPFFLFLLKMGCDHLNGNSRKPYYSQRLEKFSQACVEASQRTIILARAALDDEYLPQCNPFVIHFVFSAALIILSNEFASLYRNPDANTSIRNALDILGYCGQKDAQATRVSFILESFHNANTQRDSTRKVYLPNRKPPTLSTLSQSFQNNPTSHFFYHIKNERQDVYMSDLSPTKERAIINVPNGPAEPTMRPMMPPALQQPSPEESVSLNNPIATTTMAPGIEPLSGGDSEFDFETLWQGWHGPSPSGMVIAPTLHPSEPFGSYGLHQPPLPQGNGLDPHVAPYPPSDYR